MVTNPLDSATGVAVTSILKVFDQYQAYKNSKVSDTDKGIRKDIGRRLDVILTHLNTIESRCLDNDNIDQIRVINRIRESITNFSNEVKFGISVGSSVEGSQVRSLKKKQIRQLIQHDFEVMDRMVKATQKINSIVDISNRSELNSTVELSELEQYLNGIQNRFTDRLHYIADMK